MGTEETMRAAVIKFLAATGHDLCHENRRELAEAFGLPSGQWPCLPPEKEFRERCDRYRQELYGADGPVEHEVKSGSCWRRKADELAGSLYIVWPDEKTGIIYVPFSRRESGFWLGHPANEWSESDFRAAFTWEADPGEKS